MPQYYADSPLLGPYLRARALAQQMRQQQLQEEHAQLQNQLLRERMKTGSTDRLLELAMQGVTPFKANTGSPGMERLFTPERVVDTPEGPYKVPTKQMKRREKLDEMRDTYRAKHEIEDEFDPLVDYTAGGKTYKVRQSKLNTLIDDEIRSGREDRPTIIQGLLPTGELGYAGINRLTGQKLYEGATGLVKPTTPDKPTEGDYEREAVEAELGGRSPLTENPEYVQLSEQYKRAFFQAAAEDNAPISWEDAWRQADEYIRRKHKGVDRYIDVRKTPEFQQSVNRRIIQTKGERRSPKLSGQTKADSITEFPASKLAALAKEMGFVDKQGKIDINRTRRSLALKKIKILEDK